MGWFSLCVCVSWGLGLCLCALFCFTRRRPSENQAHDAVARDLCALIALVSPSLSSPFLACLPTAEWGRVAA